MVKKKVIIPADTTIEFILEGASTFSSTADSFSILVRDVTDVRHGAYEFNINTFMSVNFFEHTLNPVITKIELKYWYHEADTAPSIESLEFVQVLSRPSTGTARDIHDDIGDIHGITYATSSIHGVAKATQTVVLGSSSDSPACVAFRGAVRLETFFAVGIRKDQAISTTGSVQIGGLTLNESEATDWEVAGATEVQNPPVLIVTYELDEITTADLEMRYTTSDPTTSQGTPSNSIGAYTSSNVVYSRAKLGDHVNPAQETIPIADTSSLPSNSAGLIQLGPEIIKYEGIDTSNRQLISLTRGIVPSISFPATVEPFAEQIHYLEINNLFDFNPASGVDQYRCIAIINVGESRPVQDVKVFLRQQSTANVRVDIGIEVPEFDTNFGAQFSTEASDGQIISDDTNFTTFSTGFFDGAHMSILSSSAIVESFDVDSSGVATFILDRNVGTVNTGESFRINPAPAQRILNDIHVPVENSGRFLGFFGDGGSNDIGFNNIRENGSDLNQFDLFYIWIKRTLISNIEGQDDTGAVMIIQYVDPASS